MSAPTFLELGVPERLASMLSAEGKDTAFPVQAATLPDSLAGRDVLGRGRTGSGKTLAFSLPLVTRLGESDERTEPFHPRALILAPTRELANQIDLVLQPLARAYRMRTVTVYGGVSQRYQVNKLERGADIVVATPGRLQDLMRQRKLSLDSVQVTVVDEADQMSDMGFLPEVTAILQATPEAGQVLLFSATLDNDVQQLVDKFMSNPVSHGEDEPAPVSTMTHHVFHVRSAGEKKEVVEALASGEGKRILFTRTRSYAEQLAQDLTDAGIPALDLHGDLSQKARERNLKKFAGEHHRVLVATDVAARGVHVDGIELVVHVDVPGEAKAYLHRSGRTARAGEDGDVVTMVLPRQKNQADRILREADINVRPVRVHAESPEVLELRGEPAERREPGFRSYDREERSGGRDGGRRDRFDRDDRRGGYGRDRDDRRGGYDRRDRDDRGYGRDDRRGGYERRESTPGVDVESLVARIEAAEARAAEAESRARVAEKRAEAAESNASTQRREGGQRYGQRPSGDRRESRGYDRDSRDGARGNRDDRRGGYSRDSRDGGRDTRGGRDDHRGASRGSFSGPKAKGGKRDANGKKMRHRSK